MAYASIGCSSVIRRSAGSTASAMAATSSGTSGENENAHLAEPREAAL